MPLVSQKAASAFVAVGTDGPQDIGGQDARSAALPERCGQRPIRQPELALGGERLLFDVEVGGVRERDDLRDGHVPVTDEDLVAMPDAPEVGAKVVLEVGDADGACAHLARLARVDRAASIRTTAAPNHERVQLPLPIFGHRDYGPQP
jgi:hypothetical protein